jgi:hypothetical protein
MQEQCTGTVAARLLHAPPSLAARGFTRRRKKKKQQGGSGSTSSPLLFLAGGEDHRHLQNTQKRNKQVCFSLFCF